MRRHHLAGLAALPAASDIHERLLPKGAAPLITTPGEFTTRPRAATRLN